LGTGPHFRSSVRTEWYPDIMAVAVKSRVSEVEFLSLPESLERVELIDGEVIVAPSPTFWHQEILRRLVLALGRWAEGRTDVTIAQAPLDVRFGPNRILQPDAMVFAGRLDRGQAGPIDRVPEICIEILSSNRAYDRVTKRLVYAAAGVREYWLVDPAGFIERWSGPDLGRAETISDHLESSLLPGFELNVTRLLDEG
jgi:Uma2 family endonuclease